MIKISRSLIFLIIFYLLGYTGFLGGPYELAKFIFIFTLVVTLITFFITWRMSFFSKKIYKESTEKETIKVDAKVIE